MSPFAYAQVTTVAEGNVKNLITLCCHIGHVIDNACHGGLSLTRGRGKVPQTYGLYTANSLDPARTLGRHLHGKLGGSLKFKEKLTGRLGDILSWMLLLTAFRK